MPFIPLESKIPDTRLGLWKVEEDELFFLERVKLYENEWVRLSQIAHPQKRLEWLSSRLCLKELLKIDDKQHVESLNNPSGKPYLSNYNSYISYSHSGHFSTAIASSIKEVGVDIEYLGRKRNIRTRFLFMNQPELDWYDKINKFEAFILIWSAKETLYKIMGEGFAFKDNLFIQLENFNFKDEGIVKAIVRKDNLKLCIDVNYIVNKDFVLTYSSKVPEKEIKELKKEDRLIFH
ncbi:MAG: 4'-phosphopantetheinyl transferase superfamily protein [Bacteroidia bacterium]|nr:4'-phosphopantetheinyl transferase superfamily protein [Bacteroidia bacterium]